MLGLSKKTVCGYFKVVLNESKSFWVLLSLFPFQQRSNKTARYLEAGS